MSTFPNPTLRILVAEDEQETREHLEELLKRLGHEVFTVTNGEEFVEVAQKTEPDLIISDVVMPDKDGIEASLELSKTHSIPVIVVSAHHDNKIINRIGTDHIMGYLIKPVDEADVNAAITVAMARFQQFQQISQEAHNLRQALEDRKRLEKAKGIVMRRLRIEEADAFRRMQKLASNQNRKVSEVATVIIECETIFEALERLE